MVTPANQMAARHHYIQAALPQSKHGVASIRTQPETLIEVEEALHRISVRIVIEPWRASAFPIIKDLMVDRSAFDRIIESGGFITAPTGGAPDANLIPIPKTVADAAMDASQCIGCGACVAACPNGAANLFTGAKIAHLNLLPKVKQNVSSALRRWWKRWTSISDHVPIMVSAKQHVRKKFQLMSLR